jgi:uracil-DNA glycosylase
MDKFGKMIFNSWYGLLKPILSTEYFQALIARLNTLYKEKDIWPKRSDVFRAFKLTRYRDLKVVILGMDPYANERANGLAFANSKEVTSLSPSLRKIWETIEIDYYNGLDLNFDPTLEKWAGQGVLLINTALTVEKGKSGSHCKIWEAFTEFLLKQLSLGDPGIIYCLWGKNAQEYKKFIDTEKNYVIEAEHPSYAARNGRKWDFSFKQVDKITDLLYGENIKW